MPDVAVPVEELAVEIRLFNDVVLSDKERAYPSFSEPERCRTTEPAETDNKDSGVG